MKRKFYTHLVILALAFSLLSILSNLHPTAHTVTRLLQPVVCPGGTLFEDWSCGK